MPNTGEAILVASADPVFKNEMTTFDSHLNPVSEECYDAVARHKHARGFEVGIVRMWELTYGLRSCHGSTLSFGGQGLPSARNRWQARFLETTPSSPLAVYTRPKFGTSYARQLCISEQLAEQLPGRSIRLSATLSLRKRELS